MIQEWLSGKQGQVFRYKMEKFVYALDLLGSPHLAVPVVHVAGTNGKGSTVAMLRALFQEHRLRVGSFTSPHLVSVEDRICINGTPISSEDFWRIAEEIRQLEKQVGEVYEAFSYFETLTLLMFVYFQRQKLDIAVIEVGIGGLHDVTNVVQPLVSAITSVGLDHQELLGDGLEVIAFQKAGIIKPGVPVALGNLPDQAVQVCRQKASELGAPMYLLGSDFEFNNGTFSSDSIEIQAIEVGLLGVHQLENAAVALESFLLAMQGLQTSLQGEKIRQALSDVRWGGRLEMVSNEPAIYLDGAHNIPAMERLIDYIGTCNAQSITVLFAALQRKDYREMVALLQERLPQARLVITHFEGSAYEAQTVPSGVDFTPDYRLFIEEWEQSAGAADALFVTGSLYFISDVRAYLLER